MSSWQGSLYCVSNGNLFSLHQVPPKAMPTRVVEAAGPQVLPLPSRLLSERQLADWFTAWERAGYEFRHAG